MNNHTNIAELSQAIYNRLHHEYIETRQANPSIQERINAGLPYLFIMLQACFFILSAAHTIDTVSRFVPGFPALAALGLEIGLFGLAFLIHQANHNRQKIDFTWRLTEILIFSFIILANITGSLLTLQETLPVGYSDTVRIILNIVAVVFSFIIPIGSVTVGQAIAKLFLDQQTERNPLELRWKQDAYDLLYPEFFTLVLSSGVTPGKAKQQAHQLASSFTGSKNILMSLPSVVPSRTSEDVPEKMVRDSVQKSVQSGTVLVQGTVQALELKSPKLGSNRPIVEAKRLLVQHPEYRDMTTRELQELTGINKNVWSRAKQGDQLSDNNNIN